MIVSDFVGLTDVEIEALTRSSLHYRTHTCELPVSGACAVSISKRYGGDRSVTSRSPLVVMPGSELRSSLDSRGIFTACCSIKHPQVFCVE